MELWGTEEDNDGDPPRLWAPNATYPGTAFTRSIGDSGKLRSAWLYRVKPCEEVHSAPLWEAPSRILPRG